MIKLFVFFSLLLPCICFSDSPSRTAYEYKVCSSKKYFCAVVSEPGGIKVFRSGDESNKNSFITIPGWYPQVFISDDGQKIVAVGSTLVPSNNFDQPVVKFFFKNKPAIEMNVQKIVQKHTLTKTTSGYHWGEPIGFNADDSCFSFKTDDGTIVNIPF